MAKIPFTPRKIARKEIEQNLTQLEFLKNFLGEKEFEKRIKKATKLLTYDLPKTTKLKKVKGSKSTIQEPSETTSPNISE